MSLEQMKGMLMHFFLQFASHDLRSTPHNYVEVNKNLILGQNMRKVGLGLPVCPKAQPTQWRAT